MSEPVNPPLEFFWQSLTRDICAGNTLMSALARIREETDSPRLAELTTSLIGEIERGSTLSAAMRQHSEVFREHVLLLVEGGERAGILDRVLVLILEHVWRCPDCLLGPPG